MDTEELLRAVRARVPLDAAELLANESLEKVDAVLRKLPQAMARLILAELPEDLRPEMTFTNFSEPPVPGEVSELMEPVVGVITSGSSCREAIDYLRAAESVADITYLYVVEPDARLAGLIVIRDLLLANPDDPVDRIMIRRPFTLRPDQEIKEATLAAVRRHYPVYPVVNAGGALVGIVRGWRFAQQQVIEVSAQAGRMVGVTEEQVDTPIMESFRKRHGWLQINLFTAFIAGFVVSMFEGTISQIVVLAAFLPILAGQSGNTGCQALAITIRGLTLGNLDKVPRRQILLKEAALGAMNGLGTGLVAALAMWVYAGSDAGGHPAVLGLVILLAMVGACVSSGLSGVLIPLGLRRMGHDPATASSIFLTTVTDIVGMGLMLVLATSLVL